jgi:tRNA threonylcarbamoyladenosine biosynthesis protein TsaE
MERFSVALPDEASTAALGRALADALPREPGFSLHLRGDLGAGKTTLIRELVRTLPGGEAAQAASPSFNICNVYPTRPEVFHYDLYRLEGSSGCEELDEHLDRADALVAIEWAEHLPARLACVECLLLTLRKADVGRVAVVEAHGAAARLYAGIVYEHLPKAGISAMS